MTEIREEGFALKHKERSPLQPPGGLSWQRHLLAWRSEAAHQDLAIHSPGALASQGGAGGVRTGKEGALISLMLGTREMECVQNSGN